MGEEVPLDRLREQLQELVAIDSPSGHEHVAIAHIHKWLVALSDEANEAGHVDMVVDMHTEGAAQLRKDPAFAGMGTERERVPLVACVVKGCRSGPSVLLTGHVDTAVGAGDAHGWEGDPLTLVDGERGRVHGAGTCLMKGGVVCALQVVEHYARSDGNWEGSLIFVCTSGGQDGNSGSLAAIRRGWRADMCVIVGPTERGGVPMLGTKQAGVLDCALAVHGRGAHGAARHRGESALEVFSAVHAALMDEELRVNSAESDKTVTSTCDLPYATCVSALHGGSVRGAVLDSLTAHVRVSVPLGEQPDAAHARMCEVVQRVCPTAELTRNGAHCPPCVQDEGAELVELLGESVRAVWGADKCTLGFLPYCSAMWLWTQLAGVPTVVFGPGDVAVARGPDEHVSLHSMARVVRTLRHFCDATFKRTE